MSLLTHMSNVMDMNLMSLRFILITKRGVFNYVVILLHF